jgi:hypothetical protein
MGIREIVCDENYVVLGGNMRLLAMRKIGAKECTAKIVSGLTEAQKREFVIKDNGAWGQWDFDILANSWDDLPLIDWGIKLATGDDPNAEWKGMPEFEQEDLSAFQSIHIHFKNQNDVNQFAELIGQKIGEKTRALWYPEAEKINMKDVYNES